jgi:ferredoxin
MGLEVSIDRDLCMGSGNCVYEAPGAYDLDEDGISVVADVGAAPEERVIDAAKKCPTRAISVHRDGEKLV